MNRRSDIFGAALLGPRGSYFKFPAPLRPVLRNGDSLIRVKKNAKQGKEKIVKLDCKETGRNEDEMKPTIIWFFTDGNCGGNVRVEWEYRGLTSLSLKSRFGCFSYNGTIGVISPETT